MCEWPFRKCVAGCLFLLAVVSALYAPSLQRTGAAGSPQTAPPPKPASHADILRGEYGRYRANNDLLFYDLDIRVDPEKKFVSGYNQIRFKMLKDDTRIQLDLYDNLNVDKIFLRGSGDRGQGPGGEGRPLKYERDSGAVFVDFPETLKAGRTYSIDFYYSGTPQTIGRFGGFTFGKDPAGRSWTFTACEVLMVDVIEPHRRRTELVHRGAVFFASQSHDVVTGFEPAERVPLARRIGIRGGRSSEHGHDRRPRVRAQEVGGAERGVVEVR